MRRGGRDRRGGRRSDSRARRLGLPQRRLGAAVGGEGARTLMKFAVVVFPGINRERDMARALKLISGREPAMVWHADTSLPAGPHLVGVPAGFSYGHFLPRGAVAAPAPVISAVPRRMGRSRRPSMSTARPTLSPACSTTRATCSE